jgi:hypothetical protein
MVFTDLEVAEKFKSIFEDIAVADLRVALLWAARTGVPSNNFKRKARANLRERGTERESRRRRSERERAARPRGAR